MCETRVCVCEKRLGVCKKRYFVCVNNRACVCVCNIKEVVGVAGKESVLKKVCVC